MQSVEEHYTKWPWGNNTKGHR